MKRMILQILLASMALQVSGGALYGVEGQKRPVNEESSYFGRFVQAIGSTANATKRELSFLWSYFLSKYIYRQKMTKKEDERAKRIQKKIGITAGVLAAIVATIIGVGWYKNRGIAPQKIFNQDATKEFQTLFDEETLTKEGLQKLIEGGANINMKDKYGFTALHKAVLDDKPEMVELLLKYGADIKIPDQYGNTPLHYTVRENTIKMLKLIPEKGADINMKDKE